MTLRPNVKKLLMFATAVVLAASTWIVWNTANHRQSIGLVNPFVPEPSEAPKPLLKYAIPNLKKIVLEPSALHIESQQASNDDFISYIFTFTTMGKRMSGQLNVPSTLIQTAPTTPLKTVVLVRGYVPPDIFTPGMGTKNAAAVFARHGYVTLAPDFFGYGTSDAEFTDTWEARFAKPIQVAQLIESITHTGVPLLPEQPNQTATVSGIWAHSNGGQITLTALEMLSRPIPTTLWAPVTAPFPYSILFFGDEEDDEGKAQRLWISQFDRDYDSFDFSLTKHLNLLTGPLQIHHGTTDDAALYAWSQEFVQKIDQENERRATTLQQQTDLAATASATPTPSASPTALPDSQLLAPIKATLFTYPGANHNLQPAENWNLAISRDLEFFNQ